MKIMILLSILVFSTASALNSCELPKYFESSDNDDDYDPFELYDFYIFDYDNFLE